MWFFKNQVFLILLQQPALFCLITVKKIHSGMKLLFRLNSRFVCSIYKPKMPPGQVTHHHLAKMPSLTCDQLSSEISDAAARPTGSLDRHRVTVATEQPVQLTEGGVGVTSDIGTGCVERHPIRQRSITGEPRHHSCLRVTPEHCFDISWLTGD